MSNQNENGGGPGAPGDPHGTQPTEPLWPASAGASAGSPDQAGAGEWAAQHVGQPGHAGAGGAAQGQSWPGASRPPTAAQPPLPVRYKGRHRAAAMLAVALLAAGGVIAAVALAGRPSPVASQAPASSQAPGGSAVPGATGLPPAQGALLNDTLNAAGSAGPLTSAASPAAPSLAGAPAPAQRGQLCARARHAARIAHRAGLPRVFRAARAVAARCLLLRHRILRFLLLRGVDGQVTIHSRNGLKTLAFERGVIEALTPGSSLVVKASDGTTWTWDITSATVVRDRGGKLPASQLAVGEPVWAGGRVIQGAKDARLIVVRPPAAPSRR
jgi:hypothetical protein